MFYKKDYEYDPDTNNYQWPQRQSLIYKTAARDINLAHRMYHMPNAKNAKYAKTITRHIWQDSKERANLKRLSKRGKRIYKRRKETVERSFADAKELHAYRMPNSEASLRSKLKH